FSSIALFQYTLFFYAYRDPPDLHSFPTRRSSDLLLGRERGGPRRQALLQRLLQLHPGQAPSHLRDAARLARAGRAGARGRPADADRKSTRLNSSHVKISYAVFCLKKKNRKKPTTQ